jgi:hypothetical protein
MAQEVEQGRPAATAREALLEAGAVAGLSDTEASRKAESRLEAGRGWPRPPSSSDRTVGSKPDGAP